MDLFWEIFMFDLIGLKVVYVNVNVLGSIVEVSEEGVVVWFYDFLFGNNFKFIRCWNGYDLSRDLVDVIRRGFNCCW